MKTFEIEQWSFEFSRNTQSWQHWDFCECQKIENSWVPDQFQIKFTFAVVLSIKIKVIDFSISLSLKNKAVQKCKHCQLCALGENSIEDYLKSWDSEHISYHTEKQIGHQANRFYTSGVECFTH